jgi:two-component system, cell cycle sensor histidine kinase and response regulator CckA
MALSWPLFEANPITLFLIAVVISAWYGGLFPGIASLCISLLLVGYLFIEPYYTLPFPDANNAVRMITVAAIGVVVSVTCHLMHREYRRAEANLADVGESEKRFRATLENMMEGCQIISHDWRYIYLNQAAEEHGGVKASEVLGRTMGYAFPGIENTPAYTVLKDCMERRVACETSNEFVSKDGTAKWFQLVIQPIDAGLFILSLDITERKRAENRSRRVKKELEKRVADRTAELAELRGLFAAINDVLLVIGRDGRHLKLASVGPDEPLKPGSEFVGKTLWEVYDRETADRMLVQIRSALDRDQTEQIEYMVRDGDKELWYEGRLSPVSEDSVILVARDITKRKQAKERIADNERQLAEAQSLARVGTWNWDLRNNDMFWSDEHYRIFGLEPRKHKPGFETIVSRVHQEDRQSLRQLIAASLKKCEPFTKDYRIVLTGGTERVIHSIGNIVCDDKGIPIRMYGTAQDITEQRRAEEEQSRLNAQLEDERRRLNNIVTNVPGIVWESWTAQDPENQRIDFVSDYVETMLGYTVAEWLAVKDFWLSIIHPEDVERVRQRASAHHPEGRGGGSMEFRWLAKDGRVVWVQANIAIVTGDDGKVFGLRGVTTDITKRKRSEERLIQSEERYRDLVENAHDIIYSHDLAGRYTSINEAGERIMGYSREEVLKRSLIETVAPEFIETAREMMAAKLRGEDTAAYELDILAKDGSRVSVEVNTKLILHDGIPAGVQGIARDITARKQLEQQLGQVQKLESLGRLAGGIAHDFNNMLTAINGYSDLTLRRLPEDHAVRRNIEEIKKAGERSAQLTNQLLAFSRRQLLQPEIVDLNDVIADTTGMLERVIGEDIELVTRLHPKVGCIKADKGQISQIIMNLVVNARDAMHEGGRLAISTSNVFADPAFAKKHAGLLPGAYVKLAVADTGAGISEADRQHIFEPFFTTKDVGKGTGLGLATVYGIIKQSGGSINVVSDVGKGTTFELLFPRVVRDSRPPVVSPGRPPRLPIGPETLLLVEDEDVVRSFLKQLLEACGYKVIATADGASALELCQKSSEPIDLLITDVVMPQMGGRQLAEKLVEFMPQLPVLFVSGYTDDALVRESVLDADVDFIKKPFTLEHVSRKVRELLDSSKQRTTRN